MNSSYLFSLLIITITIAVVASQERDENFIVELTPAMDGKKVKPFNISIALNGSYTHKLPVSSINFRKNITLGMQLFAWYNGGWISKKSRLLRIYFIIKKSLIKEFLLTPIRNYRCSSPRLDSKKVLLLKIK